MFSQTKEITDTVVIDLDGTMAYYTHFTPEIGAKLQHTVDALHIVRKEHPNIQFKVQTCRTSGIWGEDKQKQQIAFLKKWLMDNQLDFVKVASDIGKEVGHIYLDDRCINVMPNRGNAKEIARAITLRLTHGFGPLERDLELATSHWDSYNSKFLLSFGVDEKVVRIARNYYINGFVEGYDFDGKAATHDAEHAYAACKLIPSVVTELNRYNYESAFKHGNGHGREDRGEKYPW